jgi:hypothetical protein
VQTRGVLVDAVARMNRAVAGSGNLALSAVVGAEESRTMAALGKKPSLCSGERHRHQQVGLSESLQFRSAMATVPWCRVTLAGLTGGDECIDVPGVPVRTHSNHKTVPVVHNHKVVHLCIVGNFVKLKHRRGSPWAAGVGPACSRCFCAREAEVECHPHPPLSVAWSSLYAHALRTSRRDFANSSWR